MVGGEGRGMAEELFCSIRWENIGLFSFYLFVSVERYLLDIFSEK